MIFLFIDRLIHESNESHRKSDVAWFMTETCLVPLFVKFEEKK